MRINCSQNFEMAAVTFPFPHLTVYRASTPSAIANPDKYVSTRLEKDMLTMHEFMARSSCVIFKIFWIDTWLFKPEPG